MRPLGPTTCFFTTPCRIDLLSLDTNNTRNQALAITVASPSATNTDQCTDQETVLFEEGLITEQAFIARCCVKFARGYTPESKRLTVFNCSLSIFKAQTLNRV